MSTLFNLPTIASECQSCFYFSRGDCTGLPVHTGPGCQEKREQMRRKRGGGNSEKIHHQSGKQMVDSASPMLPDMREHERC